MTIRDLFKSMYLTEDAGVVGLIIFKQAGSGYDSQFKRYLQCIYTDILL